jgi:hypothetical protein
MAKSNIHEVLEALGDLEEACARLTKAGRVVEAEVLEKVGEEILSEISEEDLENASGEILVEVVADVAKPMSMMEKQKLRRYFKSHKAKNKQWLCCTRPKKMMTHGKTHKAMWMSTCKFKLLSGKHRGQVMATKLVVGRGPKAPKQVTRKGKKLRWC